MENLTLIKPEKVQNIINKFCYTIGMIPSSYKVSLTYEEQIIAIGHYLEETVIPALNNNAEAVAELQTLFVQLRKYVENFVDNIDIETAINNKLDQMAQDGTLAEIINNKIFAELNQEVQANTENLRQLNFAKGDFINLNDYTSNEDKTAAIEEILNNNKKVFIPYNIIAKADNSSFIKEKMEKFIKNGYYITPSVLESPTNIIQERNLNKYNTLFEDMIIPSDFVNSIMWNHQKQSWNWSPDIWWKMSEYTSIVPWFQFCKNPNYTGQVPSSFNIYIGKMQVLAYDITKDTWIEVYNGFYENCAFFNYYTGGDMTGGDNLPYTTVDNYRKVSVNYNDINQKALHGWLGTSENYVPTNANYKYLAVRMTAYTDAPYGYLGLSLGLDLKGGPSEDPIAEQCGTRTKLVGQNSEFIYLTNVEPENFDKLISEDMFEIIENNKIIDLQNKTTSLQNANNSRFIQNGYVGQDEKTYTLENNSFYLVSLSNMSSGNVSANAYYIVATGNSDNNTGKIHALVSASWASLDLTNNNLKITPSGSYITTSVTKI